MANLKAIYFKSICAHLESKKEDFAMAAQDSSCEQWINIEIMLAINRYINSNNEYAVTESFGGRVLFS